MTPYGVNVLCLLHSVCRQANKHQCIRPGKTVSTEAERKYRLPCAGPMRPSLGADHQVQTHSQKLLVQIP